LTPDKADNYGKKLFFVNFGGYRAGYFGEIHDTGFYVAATKAEALTRAKKDLGLTLDESHCDDNVDVDDIIAVDQVDQHYIHLIPTAMPANVHVISGYRRLDVPDIIARASALK
jgi:hypothetical protein